MSAELRCFIDKECTLELGRQIADPSKYYLVIADDDDALNGSTGTTYKISLFVKNVGDRAALHTRVLIEQDSKLANKYLYLDRAVLLGDLKECEVVEVPLRVSVQRATNPVIAYPRIVLDFYSLPKIEEDHVNPYTALREYVGQYDCDYADYVDIAEAKIYFLAENMPKRNANVVDTNGNGEISALEWRSAVMDIFNCLNMSISHDHLYEVESIDVADTFKEWIEKLGLQDTVDKINSSKS